MMTDAEIGRGVFHLWAESARARPSRLREWYIHGDPPDPGRVTGECSALEWAARDFAIFAVAGRTSHYDAIRSARDAEFARLKASDPADQTKARGLINDAMDRYGPIFKRRPTEKGGDWLIEVGTVFARAAGDEGGTTLMLGTAVYHAAFMSTMEFVRSGLQKPRRPWWKRILKLQ